MCSWKKEFFVCPTSIAELTWGWEQSGQGRAFKWNYAHKLRLEVEFPFQRISRPLLFVFAHSSQDRRKIWKSGRGESCNPRPFEGECIASFLAKMGGGVIDCPAAPYPPCFRRLWAQLRLLCFEQHKSRETRRDREPAHAAYSHLHILERNWPNKTNRHLFS